MPALLSRGAQRGGGGAAAAKIRGPAFPPEAERGRRPGEGPPARREFRTRDAAANAQGAGKFQPSGLGPWDAGWAVCTAALRHPAPGQGDREDVALRL